MGVTTDGLIPLHFRDYAVRSFRTTDGSILLRGTVTDRKDSGFMIPDDPEQLTMHHMQVDLVVSWPDLVITDVEVSIETHPHVTCTEIAGHYKELIGTSITRGYTHRVRELFGGPKGCTHVTALLQAMGPVAFQSLWSMRIALERNPGLDPDQHADAQDRRVQFRANRNTCHVWAEGSVLSNQLEQGVEIPPPLSVRRRLAELGRDLEEWKREVWQ